MKPGRRRVSWVTIRRRAGCLVLWAAIIGGCAAPAPTEVVVLGAIHGGHRTSERYSTDVLADALRRIDPDVVLCEIPPDRWPTAWDEFRSTSTVDEPRVRRFPEYVDVLFPLTTELEFSIVPCAAWTSAMAADRRAKLEAWKTSRPEATAIVNRAQADAETTIAEHGADDPTFIHSDRYDAFVRAGLAPYDELFNDDLGPGGWTNINAAHYALIDDALDERTGRGERVVIIFGAWHKYWFLEQLAVRRDVVLLDAREYFRPLDE